MLGCNGLSGWCQPKAWLLPFPLQGPPLLKIQHLGRELDWPGLAVSSFKIMKNGLGKLTKGIV